MIRPPLVQNAINWLTRLFRKIGREILSKFEMTPIRTSEYKQLQERLQLSETALKWMPKNLPSNFDNFMVKSVSALPAHSQLQQDLLALFIHSLHSEEPGFFVEFGASDGLTYSNTYLLEKSFAWKGILAEPAKGWQKKLLANRNCTVNFKCVWSRSGEKIEFNEAPEGEYSTIKEFSETDQHALKRKKGWKYEVETISLGDLLENSSAPETVSYLSIDTEGSELQILSSFDFDRYKFNFITVEHNYSENREKIKNLLEHHGYVRILVDKSEWDDWYIRVCAEVEDFIYEIQK